MTEPRARDGRSQRRRLNPEVSSDRIAARSTADLPAHVAVTLDGVVQAVLPTTEGGFDWQLPHDRFGRLLDVLSAETGASLLAAPMLFEPYRRIHWTGWRLDGLTVHGGFVIEGVAAPSVDTPIPVDLRSAGVSYGSGFAVPGRDAYVFRIALDRLPPSADAILLQPQVGNLLLPHGLAIPADAFAHRGAVDTTEPWAVRGWAQNRDDGAAAVALWLDGKHVLTTPAERTRDDGRPGFAIPFPPSLRLDRPVLVDIRIAPDGPSLAGCPYVQPPAPPYLGFFDGLDGFHAGGWVIGVGAPERRIRVEAVCEGRVVGSAVADLRRLDVAAAGLPNGRCGFHFALSAATAELLDREISIRVAGTDHVLSGSPRRLVPNPNVAAFLHRRDRVSPALEARLARALSHRTAGRTLSIVMPVHETRQDWLAAAIESVRAQWSRHWELICVDDGSRAPHVATVLAAYARADQRIRVLRTPSNVGIASAVNFGLRAARGDYVVFMDHDDALEPDAVYHLLREAGRTGADLLYSDEIVTGASLDQLIELRARPAFSHDYYLSHPYFVHLVCVRTSLAQRLAGYDESLAISADVDFVLRAIEHANAVAHVPRPLYRWRTHPDSAGHRLKDGVMAATQASLARHLARLSPRARVRSGAGFNQFDIDWPDDRGEVLIVIPTKDRVDLLRPCIDSIERTAKGEKFRIVVIDHDSTDKGTLAYLRTLAARHTVMPYRGDFNFSRMNNEAVRLHGGSARYILFLNNDVEAAEPGWLPRLRSLAGRAEVGAVGPLLLYGNGRVQHAGVIVGFHGTADHAMRFREPLDADGARNPGPNAALTSVRDYSAVTAACLMMRRTVFAKIGGFDPAFAVGYNDTDLCLRLRAAGLSVLYDGRTVLRHHESATRALDPALADPEGDDVRLRARWPRYFDHGDPFYHPLLTEAGTDHDLRTDTGWRGRLDARTVTRRGPRRDSRPPRR